MDYKRLVSRIFREIHKNPKDIEPYADLFSTIKEISEIDFNLAHKSNKKLRAEVAEGMRDCDLLDAEKFYDLYQMSLPYIELALEERKIALEERKAALNSVKTASEEV